MKAYERLLKYVTVPTASDENTHTHPSTAKQFTLAKMLAEELAALGAKDIYLSDSCYLYARLDASAGCEKAKTLGLIAHMDTSPDFADSPVQPRLIENYDGADVLLGESGRVLSSAMFPHLPALKGRTLIVTSGDTLLGADDKAGIAEIMTVLEILSKGGVPHGPLAIAFTPDEEIGEGADGFDVARFGADFAYTADGGPEGSLEYENFNALGARFTVHGVNVHPGSAKDVMKNAALIATEIAASLPENEIPARTEGYEGFYHLTDMQGNCEIATLDYIVRDHSSEIFEKRRALLIDVARRFNEKYGEGVVELSIRDQYRNMLEQILPHMHLVDNAKLAAERVGLTPVVEPIRGGTDGARLSFMGLPCPNLGTGGYAFHGPYEHITVEGMDKAVEVLLGIVRLYQE